ncbi:MAG TPA: tungsten ABC transporter substrate-binding protein, partial [Nitrospirota bacterium]
SRPWLKEIALVYQGDPGLFNQYSVIAVNPVKHPHVHHDIAQDFIEFITGPEGQKVIGAFKDGSGGSLFVPNAAK